MPYAEIYSHKQEQTSGVSGANQSLSMGQSPNTEIGITGSNVIGAAVIFKQLAPIGRQIETSIIAASGSARVKRRMALANSVGSLITIGATVSPLTAIAVGTISTVTQAVSTIAEELNIRIEDERTIKTRGARSNHYVFKGGFYD